MIVRYFFDWVTTAYRTCSNAHISVELRRVVTPAPAGNKSKSSNFSIATRTLTTQLPHCWQLVGLGKINVYGTAPTAAIRVLIASPTSARKDLDPQLKLLLIYRPRKDERLSWPE